MKKVLSFLVMLILVAFSYFYFSKKREEIFKVSVTRPVRGELISKITVNGKIKYDELAAVKNSILFSTLSAEKQILVKEGDIVKKGQELIKAYDIMLATAKEEYAQISGNIALKKLEKEYINLEKELIKKDIEIEKKNCEKELEDYELKKELLNLEVSKIDNEIFNLKNSLNSAMLSEKYGLETKNKIQYTKKKLENLENEKRLKLKEEKILEQTYTSLKMKLEKLESKELERNKYIDNKIIDNEENLKILTLKKEIKEREINIKNSPYSSPIDGIIVAMSKSQIQGEDVLYMEIADMSTIFVSLEIPDYKMSGVEVGKEVSILYSSKEETGFKGKVKRISPVARKKDRDSDSIIEVEVELENFNSSLKPGYEIEASIVVSEKKNIVKIPIYVVIEEKGKNFVYILDNQNKVVKKFIKLGLRSNTELEVEGISENDQIIKTNMYKLSEGIKVQIEEQK